MLSPVHVRTWRRVSAGLPVRVCVYSRGAQQGAIRVRIPTGFHLDRWSVAVMVVLLEVSPISTQDLWSSAQE